MLARGSSVLRIDDPPSYVLDSTTGVGFVRLDNSRRYLVDTTDAANGGRMVIARDRATGRRLGMLDLAGLPSGDVRRWRLSTTGSFQVLNRSAGVWRLYRYRLPDLELEPTITLPGRRDTAPSFGATVTESGDRARVIGLASGLLASFDPRTGEQAGPTVDLSFSPGHLSDQRSADVEARPGYPDQVAVIFGDRVELWSLGEGRRLSSLKTSVLKIAEGQIELSAVKFDPSGGRLAVLTAGHTIELWDLDEAPRSTASLPAPNTDRLEGFTAGGQLVVLC